eukprot:1201675-Amphidinium_carterae.1
MMVPDYALIGQIMFYEYGFADAQVFKFFKGLALSDAWCCFVGFNGIGIAVIAQQLKVLFGRNADMKLYIDFASMEFEVTFITMKPTFNVFIIMNLGYAGRAELPDYLAAPTSTTTSSSPRCSSWTASFVLPILAVGGYPPGLLACRAHGTSVNERFVSVDSDFTIGHGVYYRRSIIPKNVKRRDRMKLEG